MLVCHQNDVCKYYIGSVYAGGMVFLAVGKSSSSLLQSIVMSYVDYGDEGWWSDYIACSVVHYVRLYSVLDTVVISSE